VMVLAVKMLDVGGIGVGNRQLGRLKKKLTLPYGVRFEQLIKCKWKHVSYENMSLCYRSVFASNPPSDVIMALVQPTKALRVSKSAIFARG
jgi:hypothetical protein